MSTSDRFPAPANGAAPPETEVIKELEERGFHGLDALSLEELQLLTERKRRQLQTEATERKALLESEISDIEQQIQALGARKIALAEELAAVLRALGLPAGGGEKPARRAARKNAKAAQAMDAPPPESAAAAE